METKWKSEWKGEIMLSHGSSNSKEVCILLPPNLDYTINDKTIDDQGRLLILNITINSNKYILCNVYAPTRDFKTLQINFLKI